MTKLINATRDAICNEAIKHAFEPKAKDISEREDVLAREAYAHVFSKDELSAVAKVPSNWIKTDKCLNFNVAGMTICLDVLGDGLPVPYRVSGSTGYSCHTRLGSIAHGDLAERIQKLVSDREQLKTSRATAKKQLSTKLYSINTFKQLAAIWPEGKQFYERYEAKPLNVPALRMDDVNALLGLEVAEHEAL